MRALRFLFGEPHVLTNADVITYFVLFIVISIALLVCMIWNNDRPLRKGLIFISMAIPFFGALAAHFFASRADDDSGYIFISILSLFIVANIASLARFVATI